MLDRVLKKPCVQKSVEHSVRPKVLGHTENGVNKPDSPMPLLFGHGSEHVICVQEVEEHEGNRHIVDLPQEVLVGKSVCVLIEQITPARRCSRGVEPPRFTEASVNQVPRCALVGPRPG